MGMSILEACIEWFKMSRKIPQEVSQKFPTLNRHARYKVYLLKDRRDFLVAKNEGKNDPNHYDLAEIGALEWAIEYIYRAEKKAHPLKTRLWSVFTRFMEGKNHPLTNPIFNGISQP